MNSLKAIIRLEALRKERETVIHNNDLFLEDIKAINLAIKALKKCPNLKDDSFKCKLCGKELRTWKSIQKGFGPVCEKKYWDNFYKKNQIRIEEILQKKGEVVNGEN